MSESAQIKLGVAVVVLFLFSFISSCSELRYIMRGIDAEAQLVEVKELQSNSRRGGSRTYVVAKYRFEDKDGTTRTEMDRVSSKFQPELGVCATGAAACMQRPTYSIAGMSSASAASPRSIQPGTSGSSASTRSVTSTCRSSPW